MFAGGAGTESKGRGGAWRATGGGKEINGG